MRILIYGAGVVGCEIAHELMAGQNDITLLARGKWKEVIDKRGLQIRHSLQLHTTTDHIHTIEALDKEDRYDLIFVTVEATQISSILPSLYENDSKYLIFVGNNMDAIGLQQKIVEHSKKEIAFAFASTGGRRENNKVISIHVGSEITIGGAKGELSANFNYRIAKVFEHTKFKMKREAFMDGWLKCHLAFILPLCFICYQLNGDFKRINKKQINQVIDAVIDAHWVYQRLDIPIRPDGEEEFYINNRRKCVIMIQLLAKTPAGKLALVDHAMHAREEIMEFADEFEALREKSGIETKKWNEVRNLVK